MSKDLSKKVYDLLKSGLSPAQIKDKLEFKTLQNVNYYLAPLKKAGVIKRVGYGVWEVIGDFVGNYKKEKKKAFNEFSQDSARGHAFQFKLSLPENLANWDKRAELFDKVGIKYRNLNIFGGGQALEGYEGKKIHLTAKSIIIYEKESFIEETAKEAQSKAVNHFLKIIKRLERDLRANFSYGGKYKFKVTRQHYALIKNALAKQYNDEGQKLEVYNGNGLWLLIDNSFNLNETETVHPKTAVDDNEKVKAVFNNIKGERVEVINEMTHGNIKQALTESATQIKQNADNLQHYADNIKSHVKAIQDLGAGVKANSSINERMLMVMEKLEAKL